MNSWLRAMRLFFTVQAEGFRFFSGFACGFGTVLAGLHKVYYRFLSTGRCACTVYAASQRDISIFRPKHLQHIRNAGATHIQPLQCSLSNSWDPIN